MRSRFFSFVRPFVDVESSSYIFRSSLRHSLFRERALPRRRSLLLSDPFCATTFRNLWDLNRNRQLAEESTSRFVCQYEGAWGLTWFEEKIGKKLSVHVQHRTRHKVPRTLCRFLQVRRLSKIDLKWSVVVAQLTERSIPTPEDLGSKPALSNFSIECLCVHFSKDENKTKKIRPLLVLCRMALFENDKIGSAG